MSLDTLKVRTEYQAHAGTVDIKVATDRSRVHEPADETVLQIVGSALKEALPIPFWMHKDA